MCRFEKYIYIYCIIVYAKRTNDGWYVFGIGIINNQTGGKKKSKTILIASLLSVMSCYHKNVYIIYTHSAISSVGPIDRPTDRPTDQSTQSKYQNDD